MKTKAVVSILVTMLLAISIISVLPVKAQQYLKIGVIGPKGWMQWDGMWEGATLAKDWINGPGGGIVIGGTRYDVQLFDADEHAADYNPAAGVEEMKHLVLPSPDLDVDVVFGGFRTESVEPMRDEPMKTHTLFFICGAATNELIDCAGRYKYPTVPPPNFCGKCVRCHELGLGGAPADDFYKYLFRITPINSTMLVYNMAGFLSGYLLPYKLAALYGQQLDADPQMDVKVAVLAEDLDWTYTLYNMIVGVGGTGFLGPYANIVYNALTPAVPPGGPVTDFTPYLDAMDDLGVRLIVHIYSAVNSVNLAAQLATHPLKAVMCGIDVRGQGTEFWVDTGGGCEYEAFLCSTGTRTPISSISVPYTTAQVWDLNFDQFGHAPIYTSWGVYDGIIAMHDMLEAQTGPTYITPPFDTADSDALVLMSEATNRNGVVGRFKYTTYHDVFSTEYANTWTQGYVRALWGQWQAGRIEVVWPTDRTYSRAFSLRDETNQMYPYPNDVTQDKTIGFSDIMLVRNAFGGKPAAPDQPMDPKWWFVADTVKDNLIDVYDALYVKGMYGWYIPPANLPLIYCNEANKMVPPA